ncbi:MAG: A/G-specific adenine glycosylase [Dehalococcoidia bacterium]|nr:A/G-specific adenine glycosylase [Dehalococcoidia bacterium]
MTSPASAAMRASDVRAESAIAGATAPRIAGLAEVQRALLAWHRRHGMGAPWRTSRDPYHALVAAVMAQQTQMARVLPAYERFLAAFPTAEALAGATTADVIRAWSGMGYNQRALRLRAAARIVVVDGWPREMEALSTIDGIGPFTAAVVASFAFGRPAACIDTNVRRVLGRLAGEERITPAALRRLAGEALVVRKPARWNQALMDYGARICTPRPKCDACVVAEWCASRASKTRGTKDELPSDGRRVAEERATYEIDTTPKRMQQRRRVPADDAARRYYRGRTIDLLRGLAPGGCIDVDALPPLLGGRHPKPSLRQMRAIVASLVRDGLAVLRPEAVPPAVSLPED